MSSPSKSTLLQGSLVSSGSSNSLHSSTSSASSAAASTTTTPNLPTLDWKFQQVFGDSKTEEAADADIISSVEFDPSGNFLAIGDRGGRVVILERVGNKKVEYKVMTEFLSHEPEFDYLKSLEIEEKINQIKWCNNSSAQSHLLLTTNDKTIKLWKVQEKQTCKIIGSNLNGSVVPNEDLKQLRIPKVSKGESSISHTPKKVFGNAHAYHINSISLNSDGETFLSADDLRINLWHYDHTAQSHTVVDIKPPNMEELQEVITSASFHPTNCNLFMYSSSKGTIKIGDMRRSSTCTNYSKVFEVHEDPSSKTFFSEIIASISDAKFSPDGRTIVSRDYMTLKLWDLRMDNKPSKVLNIHEGLRSKLCDLYENDCIFDKFECCFSGDGNFIATGSYKNQFHIFDRYGKSHTPIEASRVAGAKPVKKEKKTSLLGRTKSKSKTTDESFETSDFSKKCLHMSWHPQENTVAVAAVNSLYIFSAAQL